jgi:hypothetical protein
LWDRCLLMLLKKHWKSCHYSQCHPPKDIQRIITTTTWLWHSKHVKQFRHTSVDLENSSILTSLKSST